MNSATRELLEQHFDTAFAAPNGIKKLRELILTLAMQGKLVPQDPRDPPASQLLKEIEAEKSRLWRDGKIKATKPLPELKPREVLYDLPIGWIWSTLAQVAIINPRNNAADSAEVSFVPMTLIGTGNDGAHEQEVRAWADVKQGFTHFAEGDIGVAKITPCFENSKACVFSKLKSGLGAGTTELHIVRPVAETISPRYVLAYLKSPQFLLVGQTKMTGTAGQKRLPKEFVESNPFPLPPLAEQHRIVAKIDQLMARCDELEKLRAEREQKRRSVHTAALKQLLDAPAADSVADAWQFISQHFRDLYAVKENVAELRKAVLQLAVTGKLVPQNPSDPPASQLLKEIEAEKKRLVKEGKIRGTRTREDAKEIKAEEMPYALPQGWKWVRFFTVNIVKSKLVSAKDFPLEKQIAPDSIEKGSGRLLFHRTVAEFGAIGPNNRFYEGQILYSKIRPSLNKAVIAPYDGLCSADMYPIKTYVNPDYMLNTILSEVFLVQVRLAENRIKMPKLNLESLGQFIVPLPPFPEQYRIVAKINQLMALCDTLDQKIDAATSKQTELLDALMAPA